MLLERIVSERIAHNSYVVGSRGEAAVIDPRRDVDAYLELARARELRIRHVLETHRNEDYVTGSVELAAATGAQVHHGSALAFGFGSPIKEGDALKVGALVIEPLETPGHTPESLSFVLRDTEVSQEPYAVFTGDALFSGDVGRTDLAGDRERASSRLYESLHGRLLPLGDGVVVCPAHGAGSVCGGEIADHPLTTIGYERRTNPWLRLDREAFVERKVAEHHYRPPYFDRMEELNLKGPPLLRGLPDVPPLTPGEVKALAADGARLIDVRDPPGFAGGHVPGSLNIWRAGFSSFVGYVAGYDRPLVLIDDHVDHLDSLARQCVRLGYDDLAGHLAGGFAAWCMAGELVGRLETWTVKELDARRGQPEVFVLDVRDVRNRAREGWVRGSHHIWVGELEAHLGEVPRDRPVAIYCDSGYKTGVAASILVGHGLERVAIVLGGMLAWKRAGLPVEK
jgi:hydroxyacylglutathione hydrolase